MRERDDRKQMKELKQLINFDTEEIKNDYKRIRELLKELRIIDAKYDLGWSNWDSKSVLESQMETELGRRMINGET